jgi:uncharacterized protein (TIGR02646 family)
VRSIRKGPEPRSLTGHRASAHASYDNFAGKDSLRASLVAEQGGLCCYCLSRIRADSMKIEHWRSQSRHPLDQLDYSNLLGVCMGNEGQPRYSQHCDARKGDLPLSRNPANPAHRIDDYVRFLPDGRIVSRDPKFDAELNDVLNLNFGRLKENRSATLRAFLASLPKFGELQRTQLERLLQDWNEASRSGELRPFCQVVVYWLRKRLARV